MVQKVEKLYILKGNEVRQFRNTWMTRDLAVEGKSYADVKDASQRLGNNSHILRESRFTKSG